MNIADKIINDMAIKHDGFIMICDSCKHLYTGECDPNCKSLTGFESIAKSLVAELVELRQTRTGECEHCADWRDHHNKQIAELLEHYEISDVSIRVYEFCPDCGRKLGA